MPSISTAGFAFDFFEKSPMRSLKGFQDCTGNIGLCGKLITEKVLRGGRCDLAMELRNRSHPGACWKLPGRALYKLRVWQAHVWGKMNDLSIFHHDQHGVTVTEFDFVAHNSVQFETMALFLDEFGLLNRLFDYCVNDNSAIGQIQSLHVPFQ